MDQANTNMDGEYEDSTVAQSRTGLALQINILQGKGGIASARKDLHCSFTKEVNSLKYHNNMSFLYRKCLITVL